jgi:thiamine biosynthesis lipoprotein
MDADTLFSYYKKFYDITDGKVTPLIGDVLSDAGYNLEYTLVQSKTLDRPLPWDEVLEYRYPKLVVKKKTTLDFGAGGKGYLIDIISSLMEKEGIEEYCIDAGGDMLVRNSTITPLQVGLEDPEDINKVIGTVSLVNQSIAGSAGNRRVWGEFHHIIDPETLTSPRHTLGLWVIAQNTILADLLATALFFTEPSILAEHFQFEFLVVHADRSITKSQGFVVDLFS